MGISKAKGFARANRLAGERRRVCVLTGDGELQEGQFWESLTQAANEGFGEITAIVDHNKIQSDTWVAEVSDLGDLEAKLRAFGWAVGRCDGNDIGALSAALEELERATRATGRSSSSPTRVKGAGVVVHGAARPRARRATALYAFHSGAPSQEQYERALAELRGAARRAARADLERTPCGSSATRCRRVAAPARTRSGWSPPTGRRWPTGRRGGARSWRSTPTSSSTPA